MFNSPTFRTPPSFCFLLFQYPRLLPTLVWHALNFMRRERKPMFGKQLFLVKWRSWCSCKLIYRYKYDERESIHFENSTHPAVLKIEWNFSAQFQIAEEDQIIFVIFFLPVFALYLTPKNISSFVVEERWSYQMQFSHVLPIYVYFLHLYV